MRWCSAALLLLLAPIAAGPTGRVPVEAPLFAQAAEPQAPPAASASPQGSQSDTQRRDAAQAAAHQADTPALIAMLSGDRHEQYVAVSELGDRGPAAAEAAPALAALLDSPHENIRFMAGQSLGHLGRAGVEELVAALKGATEPRLRAIGVGLRGVHPEATNSVPLLVKAAQHEDAGVRDSAVRGLAHLIDANGVGPAGLDDCGPQLVPQLVAMLGAAIQDQLAAVEVVRALGPTATDALPVLTSLLDSDHYELACRSAQALAGMAQPGVRALVVALDGAPEGRRHAIECGLRDLRSTADEPLPWLMRASRHSDPEVRRTAFAAIGRLGPPAREALPRLFATVTDRDLSDKVEGDIRRIDEGFGKAYRYTADILHRQATHGAFGVWHLGEVPIEARDMALRYVREADISDPGTQASLQYLNAKLDRDPEAQIEALMRCVQVCPPWQRVAAIRALGELGPRAERAVALIARAGQARMTDFPREARHWPSRDEFVAATCKAAREALIAIQPDRAHIPEILRGLRSESPADRIQAAERLGRIATPDDAEPVSALVAATDDPNAKVRKAAERSLSRIEERTLR